MKKAVPILFAMCLFLTATLPAAAQATTGPAQVIQIFREEVKPGKGAAHEKVEAGWPRAYAKANWPNGYIAITSVTGPNEAWFISMWDSLAAMEKDREATEKNAALTAELDMLSAQDGELLSGSRGIIAVYQPKLSHNPRPSIAKMRYLEVITFRVRPGHEQDFTEAARMYGEAAGKADPEAHWGTFRVTSGMPGPTYLVLISRKSLAEMDENPEMERKWMEAFGEENGKKLQKMAADGYINEETNIFAFSPKMSYVTKEFAAGDPDYWHPKPKPAPAPAAKKDAAKPGAK